MSEQTPLPKKFSNHWKTHEIFFQSLENPAYFFQPLEKYFPIIGKPALPRRATGLCKTQAWIDGPTGEVRLDFFADHTRFDNRIEAAMPTPRQQSSLRLAEPATLRAIPICCLNVLFYA